MPPGAVEMSLARAAMTPCPVALGCKLVERASEVANLQSIGAEYRCKPWRMRAVYRRKPWRQMLDGTITGTYFAVTQRTSNRLALR